MTAKMTRPTRPSRKDAFTDDEAKIVQERDKLGDALALLKPHKVEAHLQSVPPLPAGGQDISGAAGAHPIPVEIVGEGSDHQLDPPSEPSAAAPVTVAVEPQPEVVPASGGSDRRDRKSGKAAGTGKAAEESPKKPPAAWISSDVYTRLVDYSDTEKRMRRAAARPFGVIAMDAIENHAAALAAAWKGSAADSGQPGGLFVRELHSPYRRHELPPRSITLQGVGPENAKLLKRLKKQWGARSVSDLVEKALRLEFGMERADGGAEPAPEPDATVLPR